MNTQNKVDRLPSFTWAVGIEDTFVPQAKPGMRPLEEYELTQHYRFWRDDLAAAAKLGVQRVRWGVPWYKVETAPGQYDWSWVDEVLTYIVDELKLEPIVDLVHYGTPLWMERSFDDPEFPQAMARFTRAFTERYKDRVRCFTPLNEPYVTAEFAGRQGAWPPYLQGDSGFVRVLLQAARGMQAGIAAIKAVKPDATIFAVEAMEWYTPVDDTAAPAAAHLLDLHFLPFDLVCGRVTPSHSLYDWLLQNGATAAELSQLVQNHAAYDVFGVNFYPWSSYGVSIKNGSVVTTGGDNSGRLIADVMKEAHLRTRLPLFITETSAPGDARENWMKEVIARSADALAAGLPLVGLTWFPLFSMIEWNYRFTNLPITQHILDLGLMDARFDDGVFRRTRTPLYQMFADYVRAGAPAAATPAAGSALTRRGLLHRVSAWLRNFAQRMRRAI